jgi:hypothetical protein
LQTGTPGVFSGFTTSQPYTFACPAGTAAGWGTVTPSIGWQYTCGMCLTTPTATVNYGLLFPTASNTIAPDVTPSVTPTASNTPTATATSTSVPKCPLQAAGTGYNPFRWASISFNGDAHESGTYSCSDSSGNTYNGSVPTSTNTTMLAYKMGGISCTVNVSLLDATSGAHVVTTTFFCDATLCNGAQTVFYTNWNITFIGGCNGGMAEHDHDLFGTTGDGPGPQVGSTTYTIGGGTISVNGGRIDPGIGCTQSGGAVSQYSVTFTIESSAGCLTASPTDVPTPSVLAYCSSVWPAQTNVTIAPPVTLDRGHTSCNVIPSFSVLNFIQSAFGFFFQFLPTWLTTFLNTMPASPPVTVCFVPLVFNSYNLLGVVSVSLTTLMNLIAGGWNFSKLIRRS